MLHLASNTSGATTVKGEDYSIFSVGTKNTEPLVGVTVTIDHSPVNMEIDTGASRSIMWEDMFTSQNPQGEVVEITPVSTKLKIYTSEFVPVIGSANVFLEYDDASHALPLLVAKDKGPALFGRDWLKVIILTWHNVKRVSTGPGCTSIVDRYPDLFREGGGH